MYVYEAKARRGKAWRRKGKGKAQKQKLHVRNLDFNHLKQNNVSCQAKGGAMDPVRKLPETKQNILKQTSDSRQTGDTMDPVRKLPKAKQNKLEGEVGQTITPMINQTKKTLTYTNQ